MRDLTFQIGDRMLVPETMLGWAYGHSEKPLIIFDLGFGI